MIGKEDALQWLRVAMNDPEVDFRDGQWQAIDQLVNAREHKETRQLLIASAGDSLLR